MHETSILQMQTKLYMNFRFLYSHCGITEFHIVLNVIFAGIFFSLKYTINGSTKVQRNIRLKMFYSEILSFCAYPLRTDLISQRKYYS